MCKSKSKPTTGKVPHPLKRKSQCPTTARPTNTLLEYTDNYSMYNLTGPPVKPLVVSVKLNNRDLEMELDTGASVSIISEATFNRLWPQEEAPAMHESQVKLKTYSGEQLTVKGMIEVEVQYADQQAQLQLVVAQGNGPSLFGWVQLRKIRLDWTQLCANHVCYSLSLQGILEEYSSVFSPELGTLKDTSVTISLDHTVQLRFCKPQTVPFSLKGKIEKELDCLVKQGVIEPITFSEWAAPIVPVLKKDGTVRICGDYNLTVNQAAKVDSYPLPKINDLFASLAGGQRFSKLDLASAYLQIPLDEATQKVLMINTHKGYTNTKGFLLDYM